MGDVGVSQGCGMGSPLVEIPGMRVCMLMIIPILTFLKLLMLELRKWVDSMEKSAAPGIWWLEFVQK